MKHISEKEFDACMKEIQEENASIERKQKLKKEKDKYKFKLKLPSTSKIVLLVVFLMCIEILVFSQYAVITTGDTSALVTLIGIPATLVPVCIGYYWKSKNENTAQGLVYEKTMHELNMQNIITDSEESVG